MSARQDPKCHDCSHYTRRYLSTGNPAVDAVVGMGAAGATSCCDAALTIENGHPIRRCVYMRLCGGPCGKSGMLFRSQTAEPMPTVSEAYQE